MSFPVFDLHCDTAYALLGKDLDQYGSLRENSLHIDLNRAKILAGYAQCFACYTTPLEERISSEEMLARELSAIRREVSCHSDLIAPAFSAKDVDRNRKLGKMSALLSIEGPAGFNYDPDLLPVLYKLGFRMTTLCWNEQNPLTGSHATGGGLTEQGIRFVNMAQSLGMLVDVSHISDEAFWDIIRITSGPVVASHSNSRAVCNHSRNLTDEMFAAICKTGGVVGINLYRSFLGDGATLDTVCDHVLHFMETDPKAEHISLGGDLDGCEMLPMDFFGVQDYDKLADRLLHRGLSENAVMNIFWNNALGVFKNVIYNHER